MSTLIWDRLIRSTHWLNAGLILACYFFLEGNEEPHAWAGYVVAALVTVRIAWGFVGRSYARFDQFVPSPRRLLDYLRNFRTTHRRDQPLPPGHNPLGALMVLLLLVLMLLTAFSGWLQTTDYGWGEEWVQNLHIYAADALLVAAGVHVLAVLLLQWYTRTPLIRAMLTGRRGSSKNTA